MIVFVVLTRILLSMNLDGCNLYASKREIVRWWLLRLRINCGGGVTREWYSQSGGDRAMEWHRQDGRLVNLFIILGYH